MALKKLNPKFWFFPWYWYLDLSFLLKIFHWAIHTAHCFLLSVVIILSPDCQIKFSWLESWWAPFTLTEFNEHFSHERNIQCSWIMIPITLFGKERYGKEWMHQEIVFLYCYGMLCLSSQFTSSSSFSPINVMLSIFF